MDKNFALDLFSQFKKQIEEFRKFKYTQNKLGITHGLNIPLSSYQPWEDDILFLDFYSKIKENTLVDIYRCYELYSLINNQKHLKGDVLEVGVWKGGTGCLLAGVLNLIDENAKIYLADTFKGVVKASEEDTIYLGGEHSDTSVEIVKKLVNQTAVQNVELLIGIYPDEVNIHSETILRLCHIDVDTYDSAKDIFKSIWPMIEIGGCVVFDDYGFWGCEGVTKLCNELSLENASFIYNINGHGIFIKIK